MGDSTIFALDIGTRKIAGLLMKKSKQQFKITDEVIIEQLPGAMKDGQIHDIEKVAQIITRVTKELSSKTNKSLTKAAVAAAGRSLLTCKGSITYNLQLNEQLTSARVKSLELSAVQKALIKISNKDKRTTNDTYLCVGYTVLQYSLDNQPINSLINHQGSSVTIEVIATFLPQIVVDSLTTSLKLAQLEIDSLTLEPIAAMQTVVQETMRMLNIALVDIGAGTSDIAISAGGTIKGYGMVSIAGDEVTEGLSEYFLLDFMVAEQLKRALTDNGPLVCQDALGNHLKLTEAEVIDVIEPFVNDLASQIAQKILELNEIPPKGVILIGGGSLTCGITDKLANQLKIPAHLVRIRQRDSLNFISGDSEFTGPQTITPIGIGYSHLSGFSMSMQKVTINNKELQFLQLPNSTVADALLHGGYTIRQLVGKPGPALTVNLNGQPVTIRGTLGKPAKVICNNQKASLETKLQGNDIINIYPPENGKQGGATLVDIVKEPIEMKIKINDEPVNIPRKILVNGKRQKENYQLQDSDNITVKKDFTLKEILSEYGMSISKQCITVKVNNQPIELNHENGFSLKLNGMTANLNDVVHDNDSLEISASNQQKFILSDIFQVYQPEMADNPRSIQLKLNSKKAGYTDPIKNGDEISISFNN